MERSVDGDDVALSEEFLEVFDTTSVDLLLSFGREILVIVVCRKRSKTGQPLPTMSESGRHTEELLAVEGNESLENTVTDSTTTQSSNDFSFQIVSVLGDTSYVPFLVDDLSVTDVVVANEEENRHNNL